MATSLLSAATDNTAGSGVAVTGSQATITTYGLVGKDSSVIIEHANNDTEDEYFFLCKVKEGSENIYIGSGSGYIRAKAASRGSYSVDCDVVFGI